MSELSTDSSQRSLRPLIVLDRDGVINHDSTTFIKSPHEWIALPGSPEAIRQLNDAGFTVVVATNQSGIGRGLFSPETLEDIHAKMLATLTAAGGRIDGIYFCPHDPQAGCDCRKPQPGLLRQIARKYHRNAADMIIVGDSLRDLEAAWAFGAPAILVRTGNGLDTEQCLPADQSVTVLDDLSAVAAQLTA
ncbi:MAG: D-glycero-beta-D-manno-heptose 1,7-bisphosphate 7-phosphatase [Gammaproteobacteria bacterium]|jgi:D-glycero-D-manno-heptose 1,7-bisphosphate phosphatase|nr:D-glycero-beta-D-manno-heptose-1,7-bisphosphate 7-phosphatase [Chromatiales bacterium]MDP7153746.1 D-glycero-beta-D-manno-heptose 1,7-bisphosphate 7-phosphatase [Gammaproteobacteria bacterium]MDP7419467.1 D-glycero-beta-D-manno-heptose 1,7-bisphosphate 7-phosphatase [Gammaproteobacteria bacterium]